MVKTKTSKQSISAARLASVQSLYESEISGSNNDDILVDFISQRWSENIDDLDGSSKPNKDKFYSLVRGVRVEKEYLDQIISNAVNKDRKFERLDVLLKAILRAGTFELLREPAVPLAVVINEYVLITHAFYYENEPAFVNGVLDSVSKTLRGPKEQK